MLKDKSLTDLRAIAQSYGIADLFNKDKHHLLQDIEAKQKAMIPEPEIRIEQPSYDPRLMKKIPARLSDQDMITEYLQPYIDRGLKLTFPEPEVWHIRFDKREDTGTLRQPPRVIMQCANKVLNG